MPASLYPTSASLGGHLDLIMSSSASENNTSNFDDSRAAAEQIALQLALLQQQSGGPHETNGHGGHHAHNAAPIQAQDLLNGHGASGSLEDLKNTQRRSQNMTECVPVPSSEHVAEIVGRQGLLFIILNIIKPVHSMLVHNRKKFFYLCFLTKIMLIMDYF